MPNLPSRTEFNELMRSWGLVAKATKEITFRPNGVEAQVYVIDKDGTTMHRNGTPFTMTVHMEYGPEETDE